MPEDLRAVIGLRRVDTAVLRRSLRSHLRDRILRHELRLHRTNLLQVRTDAASSQDPDVFAGTPLLGNAQLQRMSHFGHIGQLVHQHPRLQGGRRHGHLQWDGLCLLVQLVVDDL
jgi:hypothetical protein